MMRSLWLRAVCRWLFPSSHARRPVRRLARPKRRLFLEGLEDRLSPTINVNIAPGDVYGPNGLIAEINAANASGGGVLNLAANSDYVLTVVDNNWYGPDGLPPITSDITINGNGSILE